MQRTAYLIVVFVLFSPGDLDGASALSPRF